MPDSAERVAPNDEEPVLIRWVGLVPVATEQAIRLILEGKLRVEA